MSDRSDNHGHPELPMKPLRRHMIDVMQIRNLSPNTQRVYIEQVARFARYFHKSPELLGPTEIRMYLLHLVNDRHLAASRKRRPLGGTPQKARCQRGLAARRVQVRF
jgi:hypothetical protein